MEAYIQTRSEENGINHHRTVKEAFAAAEKDLTIWKVSFDVGRERVRLVRSSTKFGIGTTDANAWIYEPIS